MWTVPTPVHHWHCNDKDTQPGVSSGNLPVNSPHSLGPVLLLHLQTPSLSVQQQEKKISEKELTNIDQEYLMNINFMIQDRVII